MQLQQSHLDAITQGQFGNNMFDLSIINSLINPGATNTGNCMKKDICN